MGTWTAIGSVFGNLPLPPGQVTGLIADVLLKRRCPWPLPGSEALQKMAGTGLLVIGGGLNAWALAERARRSARRFELERPEELVTSGPYALTRHPMYVGWWLIHMGGAILSGSSWVLATLPIGILMEHKGVLREEDELSEYFGGYAEYATRTPRYLGFRRRHPENR
jgi:protein-S-isoprenylcysteine O-methyltransferase Ste14